MIWESLSATGTGNCDVRFDRYEALSWDASGVGCTLVGASNDGSLLVAGLLLVVVIARWLVHQTMARCLVAGLLLMVVIARWLVHQTMSYCWVPELLLMVVVAALSAGCESLMATDVAMKSSSLKTWRFGGIVHVLSKLLQL